MHRCSPAALTVLGAAAALVTTLLTGVPAASADAPRPAPRGSVSAPDQVLRKGCHRYRIGYRIVVPTDEWSAEIFVRNPRNQGLHSFAIDSNSPDPKVGTQTFRVCRASTPYGVHTLRMKVTYCPDEECDEALVEGFVTPGSFRFMKPRPRRR